MGITSHERATMQDELDGLPDDSYWGLRVDELRELLSAHEELEKAKAILFRVDGMGISAGLGEWLAERGYIDACELERDVAVFVGRPVPKRVEAALAAHDARTAGTAKEGT